MRICYMNLLKIALIILNGSAFSIQNLKNSRYQRIYVQMSKPKSNKHTSVLVTLEDTV